MQKKIDLILVTNMWVLHSNSRNDCLNYIFCAMCSLCKTVLLKAKLDVFHSFSKGTP